MNPRCQKLSELDAKTAEMDKEWYAKRDSKTEEPTKITKIYVCLLYTSRNFWKTKDGLENASVGIMIS